MESLFVQLALVIILAVLCSALVSVLRQPLIIGYIIAGILAGPYFFEILQSTDSIVTFSHIGIAFLLFLVGMNLNPRVIKDVGKVAAITGIGQIVFTSIVGYFLARLVGFSTIVSWYVSIALTFSSTIIIMKLLSDKGEIDTLYGKIVIGFLIVQDIVDCRPYGHYHVYGRFELRGHSADNRAEGRGVCPHHRAHQQVCPSKALVYHRKKPGISHALRDRMVFWARDASAIP